MDTILDYIHIKELDDLIDARIQAASRRRARSKIASNGSLRPAAKRRRARSRSSSNDGLRSVGSFESAGSFRSGPQPSDGHDEEGPKPDTQDGYENSKDMFHEQLLSLEELYGGNTPELRADRINRWLDGRGSSFRYFLSDRESTAAHSYATSAPYSNISSIREKVLEEYPALLPYCLSELFVHARLAEESGGDLSVLDHIIVRLEDRDQISWRRWVLLREEEEMLTDIDPLLYATRLGLKGMVQRLFRARPHVSGDLVGEATYAAIGRADTTIFKIICEESEGRAVWALKDDVPMLHYAVASRNFEIASDLIRRGADVDAVPNKAFLRTVSALHLACWTKTSQMMKVGSGIQSDTPSPELAEMLLANGARISDYIIRHLDLLRIPAVEAEESIKIIRLLGKYGAGEERMTSALQYFLMFSENLWAQEDTQARGTRNHAVMKALVGAGARIDNWPCLCSAAWSGDKTVVSTLIDLGADTNARDSENMTPLHYAAIVKSYAVAAVLLKRSDQDQDIDPIDKRGHTPLKYACDGYDGRNVAGRRLIKFLLRKGARFSADFAPRGPDGDDLRLLVRETMEEAELLDGSGENESAS